MHVSRFYENEQKGLLIITHKELDYFTMPLVRRKKNILRFLFYPLVVLHRTVFKYFLQSLSHRYFIGVHWGAHNNCESTPDWVDFHMSAPGTAIIKDGKPTMPMNSGNFTSVEMRAKGLEKIWDIISISKNIKVKNIDKLLKSIRKIYDLGYKYRILILVASNKHEPPNKFYNSIFEDYYNLFSDAEREDFVLLKTHPNTGFKGVSTKLLSDFYNLTKIFTLFSQVEGESRVIKEAQLCGLPVVVKNDLLGGGRDYLDETNSVFFDSYDTAHESLIYAVENYRDFKPFSVKHELSEADSVYAFKSWISIMFYGGIEIPLINMDNLSRRLPSHFRGDGIFWVKARNARYTSTDIVNLRSFLKFLTGLRSYECRQKQN